MGAARVSVRFTRFARVSELGNKINIILCFSEFHDKNILYYVFLCEIHAKNILYYVFCMRFMTKIILYYVFCRDT